MTEKIINWNEFNPEEKLMVAEAHNQAFKSMQAYTDDRTASFFRVFNLCNPKFVMSIDKDNKPQVRIHKSSAEICKLLTNQYVLR